MVRLVRYLACYKYSMVIYYEIQFTYNFEVSYGNRISLQYHKASKVVNQVMHAFIVCVNVYYEM